MTDTQYEKYKEQGIKIYKIWFDDKGKLHKKQCKYTEFDNSWAMCDWLNNSIPYDTGIHADFMYATEDVLDKCIAKLVAYLKSVQKNIIKEAQHKLRVIERYQIAEEE